MKTHFQKLYAGTILLLLALTVGADVVSAQGVTTAAISGIVTDDQGQPLPGANVIAVHTPTGTTYGASTRLSGAFTLPNMKVGGPYTITVSFIGFETQTAPDVFLSLAQNLRLNYQMSVQAVQAGEVLVTAEQDEVLNADRTGAATTVSLEQVVQLPSIKRSTRDLTRLDPRSDGNLSFGGRNWLYNNISLDGSYFNNPFGLDAPEPGGQSNAQPVPYDAIEQVQVSVAPFDVREGGFTGAGINQVTKSGTNTFKGSVYYFTRNESLVGNTVRGVELFENPELTFRQMGASLGGPIIKNKLFFFVNGEIERREDPGTNYLPGAPGVRPEASVLDQIKQRMISEYDYDPGVYQGYTHDTENEKLLAKLDWNINDRNNLSLRYNYLNASREQGPHPFVLSFGGRGPNTSSLPFSKSGYRINNKLSSIAFELNSRSDTWANRFFASVNIFRDHRDPFSEDFPTIEIVEDGVTYTTLGHEPFSIHNILDQDVLQLTNNFSYFLDNHVLTFGVNFENFKFFNSFNFGRHGLFGPLSGDTSFQSVADFMDATDPANPDQVDFNSFTNAWTIHFGCSTPGVPCYFKGEDINVSQLSVYAQDEYIVNDKLNLTYGLRVDVPIYNTNPVDNPYSRGLALLDENDNPETIDQSKLAGATPLLSPRIGFNYDVYGDRSTQLRGGVGIFTGRVPFVWIGNVVSNPGFNPNLFAGQFGENEDLLVITREGESKDPTSLLGGPEIDTTLQQSFDTNGMVDDFKWPQVFTVDLGVDHQLPWGLLGTLEFIWSKDINNIYVRNADLAKPKRTLNDGRPYFGGFDNNELNQLFPAEAAGMFVIDNTSEGWNYNITGQLRKTFDSGLNASLSYTYLQARNQFKSTEIASVLFGESPVQGDPNTPNLSFSEFGQRHRIVGAGTYTKTWSDRTATHFGLFFEVAEGNSFLGAGGNRYSFTYAGDVNGDNFINDLIYIPNDATNTSEIKFDPSGSMTAQQQAAAFNAFIEQDDYLSENRGQIAERFGGVNPWYSNIDIRIMQDVAFNAGGRNHKLQISLDILNLANLINSDWGVRKVANPAATSPLTLTRFDGSGEPVFNFTGPKETFIDDVGLFSRWQAQLGIRYLFQ
ncbi:MAG: carboxypeptidase regulatory-like domain-containing protein [Rhodothermia bacterium]|nr:MAG: carboxypeptidase regulatory-like domain-containing protein [Rhodothermia bacterium]